jgi:hypothetical protein
MVRKDKHHKIIGKKKWTNESNIHKEVRQHPAYMHPDMDRVWHTILHRMIGIVPVPSEEVAYELVQIGDATASFDKSERFSYQLGMMSEYIIGQNTSEMAREMSLVLGNFAAQQGIIDLSENNGRIQ